MDFEWISHEEIEMLIASGNTSEEATEAAQTGICQLCFRAHDPKSFVSCSRCSSFWHLKCIGKKEVFKGDWYCRDCIYATDSIGRPYDPIDDSYGYQDGADYTFTEFSEVANDFKKKYFKVDNLKDIPTSTTEKEFWKIISASPSSTEITYQVLYGSDLDTSVIG